MNLKSILILLTTITLSTAIPFAQKTPAPKPTPTVKTVDPILNSLAAAAAAASTGKNICPLSKRSKQCCQSVNSIADTITEPIGEVIPLLKGAKLSSLLGFDCMAMADTDPNDYCGKDVMCCTGKPGQNVQGGDIFKTCEPFDEAIKKKQKALDKQNQRPVEKAMSYVAMTSSMAAAAAASRSAAASSSAIFTSGSISASPTGH
ncbi:hypothetical protein BDV29DRAFT_155113 [Aspergillus leporis]|uniref:Uncharacterized protein n=1 Tax=Aspergillus leporis TaxID=41062 RepID=A0A5N5X9M8_9EURO|nr:hypothetical protein BDV29DRAFT_155113 [Aspergillus leporis]